MGHKPVVHDRAFIERRSIPEPNSGCWLWEGDCDGWGYGIARVPVAQQQNKKRELAHRIAYGAFKGPIPGGMFVRHTCDNPPCCNPEHLVLGTPKQNSGDMVRRGRAAFGEKNGFAKLTRESVERMRQRIREGQHPLKIAEEFGVSWSRVYQIKRGEGWSSAQG